MIKLVMLDGCHHPIMFIYKNETIFRAGYSLSTILSKSSLTGLIVCIKIETFLNLIIKGETGIEDILYCIESTALVFFS